MAEIKLNKRYKYAGDIFQKLIGIGFDVETATAFLNEVEDADVVEVVRCKDCKHSREFDKHCEINRFAHRHCAMDRGEEIKNVWHKYKKYYKDYSVVDYDGFCDYGERRDT
jgi:hypothetical protein